MDAERAYYAQPTDRPVSVHRERQLLIHV